MTRWLLATTFTLVLLGCGHDDQDHSCGAPEPCTLGEGCRAGTCNDPDGPSTYETCALGNPSVFEQACVAGEWVGATPCKLASPDAGVVCALEPGCNYGYCDVYSDEPVGYETCGWGDNHPYARTCIDGAWQGGAFCPLPPEPPDAGVDAAR
jgi:hypothetical protein